MKAHRDTLIVGAGLAGQLLARALTRKGEKVGLVHDPTIQPASSVAAWMINPITGIRFVLSWNINLFLPAAIERYRELEAESGLTIWRPHLIHRLFQGDDELPRWQKKRQQPEMAPYLDGEFPGETNLRHLSHSQGGLVIRGGGWADLTPWLEFSLQNERRGFEVFLGRVNRQMLLGTNLTFEGRQFRRVIFCTGHSPEPWPWKPAKGELLTVRIPRLDLTDIILRGIFLIPLRDDLYRVGATYEWDDLSVANTVGGIAFLKDKLATLLTIPFEIVDAKAAVRPILRDARPVVGLQEDDARFGVCNGFGSKAALAAPWVVDHFAEHLVNGSRLDPEIALGRLFAPNVAP